MRAYRPAEDLVELSPLALLHHPAELAFEVRRFAKPSTLLVARRVGDAQQQRLDLFDVIHLADEVQAKPVPTPGVFVAKMLLDPTTQVDRKAHVVVQAVVLVQGVHTVPRSHQIGYLSVILLERRDGDAFEEATHERSCFARIMCQHVVLCIAI
ncbi:MAG: hypothetical protein IID41_02915 [Planctomycetes bacterium]|nr:hypothetical protein [Planctomycetota bacterium]